MTNLTVELRITSVRWRGAYGGAIFAGMTAAEDYVVAVCDRKLIPDASMVDKGQHWAVTGVLELEKFLWAHNA